MTSTALASPSKCLEDDASIKAMIRSKTASSGWFSLSFRYRRSGGGHTWHIFLLLFRLGLIGPIVFVDCELDGRGSTFGSNAAGLTGYTDVKVRDGEELELDARGATVLCRIGVKVNDKLRLRRHGRQREQSYGSLTC